MYACMYVRMFVSERALMNAYSLLGQGERSGLGQAEGGSSALLTLLKTLCAWKILKKRKGFKGESVGSEQHHQTREGMGKVG